MGARPGSLAGGPEAFGAFVLETQFLYLVIVSACPVLTLLVPLRCHRFC